MANGSESPFQIVRAGSSAQLDVAHTLFREYAATLETGICLVGFERELTVLPEMYGAPDGALLLAISGLDGRAFGCAGIRRLDPGRAELKRLYVQPQMRKLGAGRALTVAALEGAKALGYSQLVLDTLDHMAPAQALYVSLGFVECGKFQSGSAADADDSALRYFSRVL
ncbi:MAG: GNAT family N-acetyltransferase [Betaproteobacteria bacterium]|nr:GNAT family N-acetyltransferase [Betaproteobacteria bacterium]